MIVLTIKSIVNNTFLLTHFSTPAELLCESRKGMGNVMSKYKPKTDKKLKKQGIL